MLDRLFEFLFKYRPAVFSAGDFTFGLGGRLPLLLLVASILAIVALLTYARVAARTTRRDLIVLATLRALSIGILIACLFRPMLLLSEAVPQRNFVGVLVDDSRSMQLADEPGVRRGDVARRLIDERSPMLADLRRRFQVRLLRFGRDVQPLSDPRELSFAAGETRLMDALEEARGNLEAVPLSGLIVLTDGADNSGALVAERLRAFRARGVPVFTVGIGARELARDLEIRRVATPRRVVAGSAFLAEAVVRHRGLAGRSVPVVVEDAGRVIAREDVVLPDDGRDLVVQLPVTVESPGPHQLTFRVPLQPAEEVRENNARATLVDIVRRRDRILFMEGEPRYEVRFIRDAVSADSALQLVVLQRTADRKFLRLNVSDSTELAGGFPTTRAELFRYRAVILGSVEASHFTHDQLELLSDFVAVRGGGLLFLGGRASFSEGGFAGTPLAAAFPTELTPRNPADSAFLEELTPAITPAGSSHPAMHIAARAAAAGKPTPITRIAVTSVNRMGRAKPGTTTLLAGTAKDGYTQPILAYQRFGRGLAIAMPIQDSWMWQMHADVPVDDPAFRTYWRQLLRWLTSETPGPLGLGVDGELVRPGQPVLLTATLADSTFVPVNDARVSATIVNARGPARDVPLEWAASRDGEYRARIVLDSAGDHTIRVSAATPGGRVLADSLFMRATNDGEEMFDAAMRAPFLQRVATETGGRFYTPASLGTLAQDVALSRKGITVTSEMDLWDMPIVFLLIISLVSAEWLYRKRRGLA